MSYSSCIGAAITLLTNLGVFTTVVRSSELPGAVLPTAAMPAVLLVASRNPRPQETRLSGSPRIGGSVQRVWAIELHVWKAYGSPEGTAADFEALVEAVEQQFRNNAYLGGLAGTASSTVLIAADGAGGIVSDITDGAITDGEGAYLRHALVKLAVRELITQ